MKLSTLFSINAVIAGLFGLAFIAAPARTLAAYGVTADAQFSFVAQLFGTALLTFGILTWMARGASDSAARAAIVLALFVGDAVGFVVSLIGQLRNVVNQLGWSTVAIYLLLALGFAYFHFTKPASD